MKAKCGRFSMESILQTNECLHIYHAQRYMPIAISYQVMNYNLKAGDVTVTWQLIFSLISQFHRRKTTLMSIPEVPVDLTSFL